MKKVLSFSLWGDIPKYTIGALKNADLALKLYPDFECWFYIHKNSVPINIINKLSKFSNAKIFFKEGDLNKIKPMCWRFESISDSNVEIMICRDTDSRISIREKMAVDEWIHSKCYLHIIRDHKIFHVYKIFGGMFGIKKYENMPDWKNEITLIRQNNRPRMYDLEFLEKMILKIPANKVLAHSNSSKLFSNEIVKKFPIDYDSSYNFIGAYMDENDNRVEEHHNILKQLK